MTTKINTTKGENHKTNEKSKEGTEPITINNNVFLDLPDRMPKAYSMNL